jgi:hypothetical protein
MKTVALAMLGLLSSLLGFLLVQEKAQTRQQAARVAELENRVHQQRAEIESQVQAVTNLEQEKTRLAAKAESTKQKLIAARESMPTAAPTSQSAMGAALEGADAVAKGNAQAKPGGDGIKGYLAKMMQDPALKKMLRTTQSLGIKQMYGDLVKQWALSPEETNAFYDLLLDRQMAVMEKSASVMNGASASATASAPAEDPDAGLKASLGDKLYQQYKDYEKTVGDRMAITQIQQRLAADSAAALSADQSKFLLNAMSEERQLQRNADPSGQADGSAFTKGGKFSMDQQSVDNFIKSQADLNARVAQRAAGMLTAQQLDSLKQYQTQMLDMQRMGMEMSVKMSGDNP